MVVWVDVILSQAVYASPGPAIGTNAFQSIEHLLYGAIPSHYVIHIIVP